MEASIHHRLDRFHMSPIMDLRKQKEEPELGRGRKIFWTFIAISYIRIAIEYLLGLVAQLVRALRS